MFGLPHQWPENPVTRIVLSPLCGRIIDILLYSRYFKTAYVQFNLSPIFKSCLWNITHFSSTKDWITTIGKVIFDNGESFVFPPIFGFLLKKKNRKPWISLNYRPFRMQVKCVHIMNIGVIELLRENLRNSTFGAKEVTTSSCIFMRFTHFFFSKNTKHLDLFFSFFFLTKFTTSMI